MPQCRARTLVGFVATHSSQPRPLWQQPGESLPALRGLRLQTLQVDSLMLQEWFVLQPVSWPGAGPHSLAGLDPMQNGDGVDRLRRGHTAVPRGSGNPCRRSCSPSICTAERVKSANPLNPRLSKTSKGAGTPQTHPWGSSAGRMLETPQDCTRGTSCSTTAARGVLPAGNSTSRAHPFPSPPVQRCRALRSSSPNIAASNSSINNASLLLPLAAVFLLLTCVSFLLTAASALPARPNRDTATAGWGRQLPLPAAPGRAAASPTPGTAQGSLLPLQASCSVQTDSMHSAAAHTTLLHAVLSRALGTEVGGHIPLLPPCLCAGTALLGTVSPQIPNSGLRQRLGPTVSTLPFPGCSRCHAPAHSCPRAEPRTSQCMPARVLRLAPCLVEQRAASCSRRQGGRS